uniref:Cytochrome P450 n=1 Tax=Steinernema glaseri TaxID=37863 RepID=A0A1I8AVF5_9BILA
GDGLTGVDQVAKPIKHLLRYRLQGNDEAIEQLSTKVASGLLEIEEAIVNSTVHLDDDDKFIVLYKSIKNVRNYRSFHTG